MLAQPYLNFDGRCQEAIDFYQKTLGAEVTMLMRFKDNPEPLSADCPHDPAAAADAAEKVMHSALRIGETMVMATDGYNTGETKFSGFSLSLTVNSDAEVKRCFDALADGGQATMPPAKTFFASSFGMVTDRFGVSWMILASPQ
ncbi:PhnB protein [Dyella sp. OK004]|uniref:VOC family protein n=1 Tax=Dyella sp. OK004 TaxID=1855292 RepID=UPI0008F07EF3|nr:VOC family protein [Dyella sp. OK004]SFR87882.1 PhnB protein [Dyella sp. OK004]